ncbi:MAG: flagellar export protein FliJ [Pirellulales bacterium]
MPQFRFRLRSLETLRRQARERCQLDLAAAESAWQLLGARSGELDRELDKLRSAVRAGVEPGHVNVVQLAAAGDFERGLRAQQERLREQQAALVEEIACRRAALIEADREVKALGKLCQLRREQFQADERRADGKSLDDAALRHLNREPLA